MTKHYDTLVLIGRFQPFHTAHMALVQRATAIANRIIFVVGSADQPRTYKNPFSFDERRDMIYEAIRGIAGTLEFHIEPNPDSMYNDQAWAARVQALVAKHTKPGDVIGIIGHKKDQSSFYLDMFPQWTFESIDLIESLGATDIRDLYFKRDLNMNFIKHVVPYTTFDILKQFADTPAHEQIIREREFIVDYKKQFASLRYPPIFVTTDAIVIQSGHILMVKRRAMPGEGLWAFPGGYLNAYTDRSLIDGMLRELREETLIKVPLAVLRGSIVDSKVFDAVDRSSRGRIITHAYKIVLPDGPLPKVKGSDDAIKAVFRPIAEIRRDECFEDHFEMRNWAIGA